MPLIYVQYSLINIRSQCESCKNMVKCVTIWRRLWKLSILVSAIYLKAYKEKISRIYIILEMWEYCEIFATILWELYNFTFVFSTSECRFLACFFDATVRIMSSQNWIRTRRWRFLRKHTFRMMYLKQDSDLLWLRIIGIPIWNTKIYVYKSLTEDKNCLYFHHNRLDCLISQDIVCRKCHCIRFYEAAKNTQEKDILCFRTHDLWPCVWSEDIVWLLIKSKDVILLYSSIPKIL